MLRFGYLCPDSCQTSTNVQIQCIFQKLSTLTSKKSEFNYPKIGLIKLLLFFCPQTHDLSARENKHGLDRHFIHKSVGKCDIIMQNCKPITHPHLSFARLEQKQKRKTTLEILLHHFAGDVIALSVCNKPLNLQVTLRGGVLSPEDFQWIAPTKYIKKEDKCQYLENAF